MTANESRECAVDALKRIAGLARVVAEDAALSHATLRALLEDIAIFANRRADEAALG